MDNQFQDIIIKSFFTNMTTFFVQFPYMLGLSLLWFLYLLPLPFVFFFKCNKLVRRNH